MIRKFLVTFFFLISSFSYGYGQTVDYFRDMVFMEGAGSRVHEFYYYHSPLLHHYSIKPYGALKVLAYFPQGMSHNRMRNNIETNLVFDSYIESLDIVEEEKDFHEKYKLKTYDAFILPIDNFKAWRLQYDFKPEEVFVFSQNKSVFDVPLHEEGLRIDHRFNQYLDRIHLELQELWRYKCLRSNLANWKSSHAEFFVSMFFNGYFIATIFVLLVFPMCGLYFRSRRKAFVVVAVFGVFVIVAFKAFFMPSWAYFEEAQELRHNRDRNLAYLWELEEKQDPLSKMLLLRALTEKLKDSRSETLYLLNQDKIKSVVKNAVDHPDQRVRMLAYTLIEFSRDSELFLEIFNEERLRDTSFMVRTRQVRCLEKFSPDDSLASDIKHFIKTMYLKEDHPYVTVRIRTVLFQLGLLTPKFLSTEKTLEGVSP